MHVQDDQVVHVGEGDGYPAGPSVLAHVGQRLLGGTQQGHLRLRAQRGRRAGDGDIGGDATLARPALYHAGQRLGKRSLFQGLGPQRPHQPSRLFQARSGHVPRLIQVALDGCQVAGQGSLGGFQVHDDAGKPLGQRVVDFTGQALAFFQHRHVSRLLQQVNFLQGQRHLAHQHGHVLQHTSTEAAGFRRRNHQHVTALAVVLPWHFRRGQPHQPGPPHAQALPRAALGLRQAVYAQREGGSRFQAAQGGHGVGG